MWTEDQLLTLIERAAQRETDARAEIERAPEHLRGEFHRRLAEERDCAITRNSTPKYPAHTPEYERLVRASYDIVRYRAEQAGWRDEIVALRNRTPPDTTLSAGEGEPF